MHKNNKKRLFSARLFSGTQKGAVSLRPVLYRTLPRRRLLLCSLALETACVYVCVLHRRNILCIERRSIVKWCAWLKSVAEYLILLQAIESGGSSERAAKKKKKYMHSLFLKCVCRCTDRVRDRCAYTRCLCGHRLLAVHACLLHLSGLALVLLFLSFEEHVVCQLVSRRKAAQLKRGLVLSWKRERLVFGRCLFF
ncbi:hypothetical protein NERG_02689 [Nematocida ausubeli]|uniref:Uncharacterized protein n=1 Tax=Nematocida ausubeli (strain ATCC PRA-371 / ERTm2) TaxID=1913371 RepID=H8ZGG8_NEMA1|nr:hypothetical protein NERG_02689 [Nematocida ausubeli]